MKFSSQSKITIKPNQTKPNQTKPKKTKKKFNIRHETSANAVAWTLLLLAQHPDKQAKLIEEVDLVLGAREPTMDDISKLKYTSMVFDESLRLYPVANGILRTSKEATKINGFDIPKNTQLLISFLLNHYDPHFFPKPTEFIPERFDLNSKDEGTDYQSKITPFTYSPFGQGHRSCIGKNFAKTEAVATLARFFQKYKVSITEEQAKKVEVSVLVTLQPKNGIELIVQKRF